MTAIRGVFGAVDEIGGAYQNDIEDVRAMLFHALGGTEGVLEGFVMSTVGSAMEVDFTAGRALVAERGVDETAEDRGYYLFADTVTTVPFEAASVADRCDAVVFAWPDPQYGSMGGSVSSPGPQIVVVTGVSGSTTPRTDTQINTAIGVGGWFRYADVVIDSTDTEINPANITLTYPDANDRVGVTRCPRKTADETTGTAIQDDDHLFVDVTSGGVYHIHLALIAEGSSTGSITCDFTHPGGDVTNFTVTAGESSISASSPTTSFTVGVFTSPTLAAQEIGLLYVASASGTLQFRWNRTTSGTGTLKEGSFMRVERVA